ncbi:MAG TPA: tetratricopeptide repeat protein [Phycisphaerales bacterium]|nr:tetratricopeptide repeat protein [Phycisphaerales bacterium]
MAARVNTKFVVLLSAGLVAVCVGVAATAYVLLKNSPADNIKAGDKAMAAKDFEDAELHYSKAVAKDQTNVEYLKAWLSAIEQTTPTNPIRYNERFGRWVTAKRQLAVVQRRGLEDHTAYLDLQQRLLANTPYDQAQWQRALDDVNTILRNYDGEPAGPWEGLKRYRAMIAQRMYLASGSPSEAQAQAVIADLEAALRANPKDAEAAVALADTHGAMASNARNTGQDEAADRHDAAADEVLRAFLAANPDNPEALLAQVQRDLNKTRRFVAANPDLPNLKAVSEEFAGRNRPLVDQAFASLKQGPHPLPDRVLSQFRAAEMIVEGSNRVPRTEELLGDALKAKPDTVSALITLAEVLASRGDFTAAVEQLEKIGQLPPRPISLEGSVLRGQQVASLGFQSLWTLRAWSTMPAGPEKDATLAKARDLRGRLAAADPNAPQLHFLDANLAFVNEGRDAAQEALRHLDTYNRITNQTNPEALMLTAQAGMRVGSYGIARDALNRLLQLQPNSVPALMLMADVRVRLEDLAGAADALQLVTKLDPANAQAVKALDAIRPLVTGEASKDPVITDLMELDRLANTLGNTAADRQRLIGAARRVVEKHGNDPRAALALATAYVRAGQREDALGAVRASMAKHPDHALLKRQEQVLSAENPVQGQLAFIENADLSEIDKALERLRVFAGANMEAEASAELEKAKGINPKDKRVVELQFLRAIEQRDLAQARVFAELAVKEGLDGYGGSTYRARVLTAEGKPREAAALLEETIKRGGAQPEVHRLLGRTYLADGRAGDASRAFEESLKLRPNDAATAGDYIRTLVQLGRMDAALRAAREYRTFGEADPEYVDLWLNVEAAAGDRKEAIAIRERIAQSVPTNRQNLLTLADLYLDDKRLDDARSTIDMAKALGDGIDTAMLDADWHWRRGDQAAALDAINAHVAESGESFDALAAKARFLLERGANEEGLAAIEASRAKQDPATMFADRALCDASMGLGMYDRALEAARRVVAGNADTADRIYQKRIVDILAAQQKFDEAKAELAKLGPINNADATTLMLTAAVRAGLKDTRGQLEALNEAVKRFPTSAQVFMRRGQALAADKLTVRDAVADFSKAIELAPDNPLPYRLRSAAYAASGDTTKAFEDLKLAVSANPADQELLFSMLGDLMRQEKPEEAQAIANAAAEKRPRDTVLLTNLGAFFTNNGRWDFARRYYRQAFENDTANDFAAQSYLDSLMSGPTPDAAEAQRVLGVLGDRVQKSPGFIMAQAKIRMQQGKAGEAARLAQDSLVLLDPTKVQVMSAWYTDVNRMLSDKKQLRELFETLGRQNVLPEWMTFFRATTLLENEGKPEEGLALLEQLTGTTKSRELLQMCYRTRANIRLQMGKTDEALAIWQAALREFPDDVDFCNNAAYILTTHAKKPEEALPLAEKAAASKLGRTSSEVLDTHGLTLLRLGRTKEALPILDRAFTLATNTNATFSSGLHLVEALIADGDKTRADDLLGRLEKVVEANPRLTIPAETKAAMQELRGKLAG